jgi:ribonuclease HI
MKTIELYTDGSSSTVYKTGGWAVFIVDNNVENSISGNEEDTTNNAMELTAFLMALKYLIDNLVTNKEVKIFVDSAYIINCFEQKWYEKWFENGWKGANKQPIKHQGLWQKIFESLDTVKKNNDVELIKVKAHEENYGNNYADRLAVKAREELEKTCGY